MATLHFYDAYDTGVLQDTVQTGNSSNGITGWDTRSRPVDTYSEFRHDTVRSRSTFTSTVPTTTNGNFTYTQGASTGEVRPVQGFCSLPSDGTYRSIPSGQWTINQEITNRRNGGSAGKFVYCPFKIDVGLLETGTNTFASAGRTPIPMYSDAALTTSISNVVESSEATSIGTTAQNCSTTFYTDRVLFDNEILFIQVWWKVTTSNTNSISSRLYYANGGNVSFVRADYEEAPFNIESPDFKRKRFVIS